MARLKVKNPETGEWFYADLVIQDDTTKESVSNKVTSLSSSSTDTEYPTAKCVYDLVGDVEDVLAELIGDIDELLGSGVIE